MNHAQIVAGSKPWIDDPLPLGCVVRAHSFRLVSLILAH
jgi:hypothetical protein